MDAAITHRHIQTGTDRYRHTLTYKVAHLSRQTCINGACKVTQERLVRGVFLQMYTGDKATAQRHQQAARTGDGSSPFEGSPNQGALRA